MMDSVRRTLLIVGLLTLVDPTPTTAKVLVAVVGDSRQQDVVLFHPATTQPLSLINLPFHVPFDVAALNPGRGELLVSSGPAGGGLSGTLYAVDLGKRSIRPVRGPQFSFVAFDAQRNRVIALDCCLGARIIQFGPVSGMVLSSETVDLDGALLRHTFDAENSRLYLAIGAGPQKWLTSIDFTSTPSTIGRVPVPGNFGYLWEYDAHSRRLLAVRSVTNRDAELITINPQTGSVEKIVLLPGLSANVAHAPSALNSDTHELFFVVGSAPTQELVTLNLMTGTFVKKTLSLALQPLISLDLADLPASIPTISSTTLTILGLSLALAGLLAIRSFDS